MAVQLSQKFTSHSALRETLNKIVKPFNGNNAGLTGLIQGFQMYFA